ncbi:hypothetical protein [Vibrio cyclitrophicus]|uniref:hypothetical protein n=1 Tax=Vibrio cyclitrophicus TaxID=47951 RepID=UPI0007EEBD71|nr:hypothetical protein [Vibrio cyclitrophicus]OBT07603.1 hypothetical protein A9265_14430 [Vibrio cyclitrophicus]
MDKLSEEISKIFIPGSLQYYLLDVEPTFVSIFIDGVGELEFNATDEKNVLELIQSTVNEIQQEVVTCPHCSLPIPQAILRSTVPYFDCSSCNSSFYKSSQNKTIYDFCGTNLDSYEGFDWFVSKIISSIDFEKNDLVKLLTLCDFSCSDFLNGAEIFRTAHSNNYIFSVSKSVQVLSTTEMSKASVVMYSAIKNGYELAFPACELNPYICLTQSNKVDDLPRYYLHGQGEQVRILIDAYLNHCYQEPCNLGPRTSEFEKEAQSAFRTFLDKKGIEVIELMHINFLVLPLTKLEFVGDFNQDKLNVMKTIDSMVIEIDGVLKKAVKIAEEAREFYIEEDHRQFEDSIRHTYPSSPWS